MKKILLALVTLSQIGGCSLYVDRLLNRDPNEVVGYTATGAIITQSDRERSFARVRESEEIARKLRDERNKK